MVSLIALQASERHRGQTRSRGAQRGDGPRGSQLDLGLMLGLNLASVAVTKWEDEGASGRKRLLSPTCRRAYPDSEATSRSDPSNKPFTRRERAACKYSRATGGPGSWHGLANAPGTGSSMRCSGSTSPMFPPRRSSRLRGKPSAALIGVCSSTRSSRLLAARVRLYLVVNIGADWRSLPGRGEHAATAARLEFKHG